MDFTETEKEILYTAWVLNLKGAGQVLEDWALPAAHKLCALGWLDRRLEDDQLTWWWSDKAETALRVSELLDAPSQN